MNLVTPDSDCYPPPYYTTVFLAGTIDNGRAKDWQTGLHEILSKSFANEALAILSPRRKKWDSNALQTIDNLMLKQQIEWELWHLKRADVIAMVFLEDSQSPISLLELGAFKDKCMAVYCPQGFYRKANVDIFCAIHDISVISEWDEFIRILRLKIQGKLFLNSKSK
jgi:hypothetical protein